MRSGTSSNTATVVTVNRQSTEALSSLETSVDGEAITTSVRVRPMSTPLGRAIPPVDITAMTTYDIAQIAVFVHQLLDASAETTRADGALSRRWLGDSATWPSNAEAVVTAPRPFGPSPRGGE